MTRKGRFLLTAFVAVSGLVGLISVPFRSELRHAHDATTRGSLIANTAAGPIEYATSGAGVAVLSIHGAAGGYDHGLNAAVFLGEGFQVIAPSRFWISAHSRSTRRFSGRAGRCSSGVALRAECYQGDRRWCFGRSALRDRARDPTSRQGHDRTAYLLAHVSLEGSRGSKLVFWLVNNGANLVWWVTEKIAPALLIRFVGVPPELVAASSKAEQDRIMNIVRSIQPLVEISGNQY